MTFSRRSLIKSGALALVAGSSFAQVITAATPSAARGRGPRRPFTGYGDLVADPNGLLDLPKGFSYRVFSREGDPLSTSGLVPASHDGMAAFSAGFWGTWLVRNHEIDGSDVEEDGITPVPHVPGHVYDPEGVGGTTTLLVGHDRKLRDHRVSLGGTLNNCAGGPTPWDTWLTCEEDDSVLSKPHGYVFEVDPFRGGNPEPIVGMGRFEHEAVAFDRRGRAYLTEDAGGPHGCFYRFVPRRAHGGRGSLHAGGELSAMAVAGVDTDLSIVQTPGIVLPVRWIPVPNVDPGEDDITVREQAIALGATPIPKAEGVWTALDGSVWFVSSRGDGPDAEDEEDVSAGVHAGQIWRYEPHAQTIELVVVLAKDSPFDGPDNITASRHGFALACTDGEDDQWLIGITDDGGTFPFALNPAGDDEFAGATFSPDGETLFVNIQSSPALTFAVFGPWRPRGR
jgi:secreted PhoX family phosphatase